MPRNLRRKKTMRWVHTIFRCARRISGHFRDLFQSKGPARRGPQLVKQDFAPTSVLRLHCFRKKLANDPFNRF